MEKEGRAVLSEDLAIRIGELDLRGGRLQVAVHHKRGRRERMEKSTPILATARVVFAVRLAFRKEKHRTNARLLARGKGKRKKKEVLIVSTSPKKERRQR